MDYTCKFCGTDNSEDLETDKYNKGFWCGCCDGYVTINDNKDNLFNIILEDKEKGIDINVKKNKRLKKQISPIRYAGGKSRLIDYIYSQLDLNNTKVFIEPFAGGGSVGLSLLEAGVVEHLIINDLDYGIYSLFNTIKNNPTLLINRIKKANLTHEDYYNSQEIVLNKYKGLNELQAAWHFLVVNRLSYSGICKANNLGGKNGSIESLLQRWNPKTLIKRINIIHKLGDKMTVLNKDALEVIEEKYWTSNATIFIDPPYVLEGKDLYNHYYNEKDHYNLQFLLESLYFGMPGADLLITYDNHPLIKEIYSLANFIEVKRVYSI